MNIHKYCVYCISTNMVVINSPRVPPGVGIPASSALDPRFQEYRERFAEVKKEYMQDRQYWYLNLIGRHPDRTEPGWSET